MPSGPHSSSSDCRACTEWTRDAPPRMTAATWIASAISFLVAPADEAPLAWTSMQYGHWIAGATAEGVSSLGFFPGTQIRFSVRVGRREGRHENGTGGRGYPETLCGHARREPLRGGHEPGRRDRSRRQGDRGGHHGSDPRRGFSRGVGGEPFPASRKGAGRPPGAGGWGWVEE